MQIRYTIRQESQNLLLLWSVTSELPSNSSISVTYRDRRGAHPSLFEGWGCTSAGRVGFFADSRHLTSALFRHKPSAKIIDYQPTSRDNRDSDGCSFEGRPSTKPALETAPKPVSALFDNLS